MLLTNHLMLLVNDLRSTLSKVEQVLDTVDEAIVWTDQNGIILWCNLAFDQLVNQPHVANLRSSLIDRLPLLENDLVSPCEQHPVMLALEPHNKGLCIYGLQKSDKLLVLEVAWSSFQEKLPDKEGDWSAVLVIRDVTERHKAEVALKEAKLLLEQHVIELQQADAQIRLQNEQLNQLNIELIRANRLKDEFLANMSHELRTPLNAILGMAEGLQEQVFGALNERQQRSLSTIGRSGRNLLDLITNILEVAKVGAGRLDLNIEPVLISHLCNTSLAIIKPKATQKHILLETTVQAGLTEIAVDHLQMRQVLYHLLDNAVKFTPEGGKVMLDVHLEEVENLPRVGQHDLPGSELCYTLCFSVTDTGIGIADVDCDQLFQPFIQLDGKLNRQYEGTGLGLFLVKQIVDLHGGQVSVCSEVGKGSCFTVRLPHSCKLVKTSASSPAEIPTGTLPPEQLSGGTVSATPPAEARPLLLLVDDNEVHSISTTGYLKARGYRTVVAKTGQDAIALTQEHHPDMILLTISILGEEKQAVIQQLRQVSHQMTLPIIALKAANESEENESRMNPVCDRSIPKPVNFKQLIATIQDLLAVDKSE